jgi:type II secretory pathway component PulK
MRRMRRAVILPLVLVVLLVMGVFTAAFSFRVHADLSSAQAVESRLQTRLAAQAGIEKIKLMLRTGRFDMDVWYNNPDELHRIVVWGYGLDRTDIGKNEEYDEDAVVYRFSIVADDPTDDEDFIRFGLTDESSKLNLNTATEQQLMVLMQAAVGENEEIDPQEIVDAILDWRDQDSTPRGTQTDTEGEFYREANPRPYEVKNGPFDTVEELLLVKGVTPQILYGEDFDRNGLLTLNEDDEDETFPVDNMDGSLNRGLYPYLTVQSYESNVTLENRPRVYLLSNEAALRTELSYVFEDEPEIIDFIVSAARSQGAGGGGAGGGGGTEGQGDSSGGGGLEGDDKAGGDELEDQSGGAAAGAKDDRGESGGRALDGGRRGGIRPADIDDAGRSPRGRRGGSKSDRRSQVRNPRGDDPKAGGAEETSPDDAEQRPGEQPDDKGADELGDETQLGEGEEDQGEESESEGAEGEAEETSGGGSQQMRSPADLLLAEGTGGQGNPLRLEHLPILMDKTTVYPPDVQEIPGLININTAPLLVLRTLPGLTADQITAILERRDELDSETKLTTAWLVTEEVLDLETYAQIAPLITARPQQFRIESLGYADHFGMVTRLEVVIDMVGPLAQIIYSRDLTHLGGRYPIREEDLEKLRVQ